MEPLGSETTKAMVITTKLLYHAPSMGVFPLPPPDRSGAVYVYFTYIQTNGIHMFKCLPGNKGSVMSYKGGKWYYKMDN